MTKAPKKPDSRAKALAGMTKAELIKTVKALDAKQTKLLNQVAKLQTVPQPPLNEALVLDGGYSTVTVLPWEMPNPFKSGAE